MTFLTSLAPTSPGFGRDEAKLLLGDFEQFMYMYHIHMGVSINGGHPKWMVYNGKSH